MDAADEKDELKASVNLFHPHERDCVASDDTKMIQSGDCSELSSSQIFKCLCAHAFGFLLFESKRHLNTGGLRMFEGQGQK